VRDVDDGSFPLRIEFGSSMEDIVQRCAASVGTRRENVTYLSSAVRQLMVGELASAPLLPGQTP
jgi:hypothetical protein